MEKSTILRPTDNAQKQYKYVLKGKEKTLNISIEDDCVFSNADGEIDCPLDMILRKNNIKTDDLMKWNITDILFVEINGYSEVTLHAIKCSTVFNILKS